MSKKQCVLVMCATIFMIACSSTQYGSKPINKVVVMTNKSSLSQAEQDFISKIKTSINNDTLLTIDYAELIKKAPTDNKGQFWYECAVVLSDMQDGQQIDMRENGRLHVAWGILDELLKSNDSFPQIWASKINVLTYIYEGYSARINVLSGVTTHNAQQQSDIQRSKFVKDKLLSTLDKAIATFPDEQWFVAEKNIFLENNDSE